MKTSRRFRVVAHRMGVPSRHELVVDAAAPLAAAFEAFNLLSHSRPEVVDVTPMREAGAQSITVIIEGSSERFRFSVLPLRP